MLALSLTSLDDAARAIRGMQVRGAPLIGAAAAYGFCVALRADASDEGLEHASATLLRTRPIHQPQMGARRDDGGGAQPAPGRARRCRLPPGGGNLR